MWILLQRGSSSWRGGLDQGDQQNDEKWAWWRWCCWSWWSWLWKWLRRVMSKMIIGMSGNVEWVALSCKVLVETRPKQLSIFQSDGLVDVFFRPPLASMVFQWFCYHWTITIECFLNVQTLVWIYICLAYKYGWHRCERFFVDIGVNGFSMVFKILKAMVRMSQCT